MPSSSRSTQGRRSQPLPAEAAAQYETTNNDVPEWARGEFTLYISYLHIHVPEKMLFSVIRQTGIGMMRRNGAIELTKHDARDGEQYPYQSAKIHFDFLFTRGNDREQNLRVLDHLLHGGDDAYFQVVYQAARHNPKTGKDEPDRYWKVKAWREAMRSVSPASAPAIKISLHGGSVGPKDVKTSCGNPSVQNETAVAKRTAVDADGFAQPKKRGAKRSTVPTNATIAVEQTVGGSFAALANRIMTGTDSATTSPNPMTNNAWHNAMQVVSQSTETVSGSTKANEVAEVIAKRTVQAEKGMTTCPTPLTDAEIAECNAEIFAAEQHVLACPSDTEIVNAAMEFLAESQIREEGAENAGAWEIDANSGVMVHHDEMVAADAETIVPPCKQLDVDSMLHALKHAENSV